MGTYSFKLPDIGEGIAEAEIVAWHVAVGDVVEEDAPLADLMTDKATVEMTAPVAGRVAGIAGEVGDMVAIGAILATFETEGEPNILPGTGRGTAEGGGGGAPQATTSASFPLHHPAYDPPPRSGEDIR